jgi:orotidine-5'-phosphate decarboxylase
MQVRRMAPRAAAPIFAFASAIFPFTRRVMACDLILVLDAPSPDVVAPMLRQLQGTVRWAKVGLEMFTACGPDCVRKVADLGYDVFLDLKLHDIPNTVAKAVESAAKLPIRMLTLHTSGGREMMEWAVRAQQQHAPELLLLGVTVLTSMSAPGLAETGVRETPEQQVVRLGQLAATSGLRGLVCSPLEIAPLRGVLPPDVALVTPGIRPRDAKADDQTRVMTPAEAARAGANFIVVGRPILKAPDPVAAARAILGELGSPRN